MEKYGERIATYRKNAGMTQSELGAKLNVTAQAVSKWENGLSEPDLATLQKMSALFNVSVDMLLGSEPPPVQSPTVPPPDAASEPEIQPQVAQTKVETKIIIGYCNGCKKPIGQDEKYEVHSAGRGRTETVLCEDCEKKYRESVRREERGKLIGGRGKGFTVGGIIGGIWLLISFISLIVTENYIDLWFPFLSGYVVFSFVSQLFWGEFLQDFILFFVRALKFPGLIFTLDLHGIIWFICVKLLFAAIGFVFSTIVFLFGLLLAFTIAAFTFPFAVVKLNKKIKAYK